MANEPEQPKFTDDRVFKYLFSRYKEILRSLLKCFLPIDDTILDIDLLNFTIEDSTILGERRGEKKIVLDLHLRLKNGEHINIEMQTSPHDHFLTRMLFYWARLYGGFLKAGKDFGEVKKAYLLVFTTFPLFEGKLDGYYHEFHITAKKDPNVVYHEDLSIIHVELNRMQKKCFELVELKDKWCYLFMHAHELTKKERAYLLKTKEIKMALKHYDEITKERAEFAEFWDDLSMEIAERDRLTIANERARKAKAEGLAEGKAAASHEIALNMLRKGCAPALIAEVTGLSEAEINQLDN